MKITKTKKIFYYFIISCLLFSCKHFNGYEISGNIKHAENTKVYLENILGKMPVIIDTATIVNEVFTLKNYAAKGIYRLRFGDDVNNSIFLYIEEKDNIKIAADLKLLNKYEVIGSKSSLSIQELMLVYTKNFAALNAIAEQLKTATPNTKDSLQLLLDMGKKNHIDYLKKYVEKESNNEVACFALNFMGPMMQDEIPYLISITQKLHEAEPKSKFINNYYQEFQQYSDELLAASEGGIALNTQAPDIVLKSPNGDTIQLKNLQGSYVLLDFWASWCQPCRMENPNVVAAYKKYHAQGFDVFSVSLDAGIDQWKKAIAKDGLVWKNHGCDFGGWNSAPAQLYNVKAIPCTFLIDKKGIVIAENLHGDQLSAKLAELLLSEKIK